MKKIFTLLALAPLASTAFGQITINAADMPVPTVPYNLADISATAAANPTPATNATWNYGSYTGSASSNTYVTETDTYFTGAGIDVYLLGFKSLIPGLGYNVYNEFDFNTANVKESGIDVQDQGYDISSMTGGTADSLIIPAQRSLLAVPKEVIHFPFTANSSWTSSSRRKVTFNLSVAAYSLSHTPIDHVYYVNRKDTIVGWGKMSVYTTSGPSIQYDVLMDRIGQYAVDSFYMGGSPAPATLLSAFGMSQGQKTDSNYRYNFYRKTSFNYLLTFYYGSNATYTTPQSKFVNTDNLIPANVGVNELGNATYSTVVFPNPSAGSEINVMVMGKNVDGGSYRVCDATGKTIQAGSNEFSNGSIHVSLNSVLAAGNYFITILDNNKAKIATEQFTVAK